MDSELEKKGAMEIRLIRLIAFETILFFLLRPGQWFLALIPVLFSIFGTRQFWAALGVSSLLRFLIPSPIWSAPIFGAFFANSSMLQILLLKSVCLALALAVVWACLELQSQGLTARQSLAVALALFIASLCSAPFFTRGAMAELVAAGFATVFRSLFWPLAAVILMRERFSHFGRWKLISLLSPSWTYLESMFIPLTPLWLESSFAKSVEEKQTTELSAFKLLAFTVLLVIVGGWFNAWAFGLHPDPSTWNRHAFDLGLGGFSDRFVALRGWSQDSPLIFFGIVAVTFKLFLTFAVIAGTSVSVARMCGFNLPTAIDKPHLAHSLSNFYFRLMRYYSEVLMQVFHPLFKPLVPATLNRKHRFVVQLILTISVGGFIYHLLHYMTYFYGIRAPQRFALQYLNAFPYFLAVGGAVGASFLLSNLFSKRRQQLAWWSQAGRVAIYFLIISALYSLDFLIVHDEKTWHDFFHFWNVILTSW